MIQSRDLVVTVIGAFCVLLLSVYSPKGASAKTLCFPPMASSVGIINYKACYSEFPGVFNTCKDLGVPSVQSDGNIWVEVQALDDGIKRYVAIINCTSTECGDPSTSFVITAGTESKVEFDLESDYNGDGAAEFVMKTASGDIMFKLSPFILDNTRIWAWDYVLGGRGRTTTLFPKQDLNNDGAHDLTMITAAGAVLGTATQVNQDGSIHIGGWNSAYTIRYDLDPNFSYTRDLSRIGSCDFDGDDWHSDRVFINELGKVAFDHTADGLSGFDEILPDGRGRPMNSESKWSKRHLFGHMDTGPECDWLIITEDGTAALEHREDNNTSGFDYWKRPFLGNRGIPTLNQHVLGDIIGCDGVDELIIKTRWDGGLTAFSLQTTTGSYGAWIGIGARGLSTTLLRPSDLNGDGCGDFAVMTTSKAVLIDLTEPDSGESQAGLNGWEVVISQ